MYFESIKEQTFHLTGNTDQPVGSENSDLLSIITLISEKIKSFSRLFGLSSLPVTNKILREKGYS
jgi:hypothetical protein